MKIKALGLILLFVGLSLTIGCKEDTPPIVSLTISPNTILQGESATLSWSVQNATSQEIDYGIGSVVKSGNMTVSPVRYANYTLTARNSYGITKATASIEVIINVIGSWTGRTFSQQMSESVIELMLIQNGNAVTGTWSAEPLYGKTREGIFYGKVTGDSISGTMAGGYNRTLMGTISDDFKDITGIGLDPSGQITFTITKK